ncbi:MAG TPA: GNAT family N-acetyltransferase [Armatimonadota bacterium]|nr:GNAT family N-acetyltransferase [Armatimonadota bacterium]HOJ22002.1 GNAT family N-acetyltransferase [Armatimonadota bacterium]HOM80444.1 GNAT family N-acetyltransferase [Armatimonadota bacterium]HPO72801.1 GNAT family N-acetyltransferase [Armatimonadota bacterium]
MPMEEHQERPPRPADSRLLQSARLAGPFYGPRVSLTTPTPECCHRLALIQRGDTLLGRQLEQTPDLPRRVATAAGAEFLHNLRAWCEERNGVAYAIAGPDGEAIGLITLYDVDINQGAGRVGFWLASSAWGRGYAAEAFALLARYAAGRGLRQFHARIPRQQTATWRVWSRLGARIEEDTETGFFRCTLDSSAHGFDAALEHALRE